MANKSKASDISVELKTDVVEKKVAEVIPDPTRFLDDEMRASVVAQLKDLGLETEGVSDAELLRKLTNETKSLNAKVIGKEAGGLQNKLNEYAHGSLLTDKDFIMRLYQMGVPDYYVKNRELFSDQDSTRNDEQIWQKIRFSRVRPIKDRSEIFRYRHPEKDLGNDDSQHLRHGHFTQ